MKIGNYTKLYEIKFDDPRLNHYETEHNKIHNSIYSIPKK